jgi:hypothetical protein
MSRTAMPEASVHEYRYSQLRKHEVGAYASLSPHLLSASRSGFPQRQRQVAAPARDPVTTQQPHELYLGVPVALTADASHHFRSFRFREYVSHGSRRSLCCANYVGSVSRWLPRGHQPATRIILAISGVVGDGWQSPQKPVNDRPDDRPFILRRNTFQLK